MPKHRLTPSELFLNGQITEEMQAEAGALCGFLAEQSAELRNDTLAYYFNDQWRDFCYFWGTEGEWPTWDDWAECMYLAQYFVQFCIWRSAQVRSWLISDLIETGIYVPGEWAQIMAQVKVLNVH